MRTCQICGKGSMIQKSGAHQYGGGWAMRAMKTRAVWAANLHKVKVDYMGKHQTMTLCSKCLRRVKSEMKPTENKTEVKNSKPQEAKPTATA